MPKKSQDRERSYYTYFADFEELLEDCPPADELTVRRAIPAYGLRREEPEEFADPTTRLVWKCIKKLLNTSWLKFESGKKGGGQTGNKNAKKTSENEHKTSTNEQARPLKEKNRIDKNRIDKKKDINREINLSLYILKEEQKKFFEELKQYREIYGDEMLTSFYATWAEPTKDGIMRKDEEKSWSTPLRLAKYQVKLRKGGNA